MTETECTLARRGANAFLAVVLICGVVVTFAILAMHAIIGSGW